MSSKVKVAILGATGTVGQRFISMLNNHPRFEIVELMASDRNVGKRYSEACQWRDPGTLPTNLANLPLIDGNSVTAPFALSALPSEVAQTVEPLLASKGIHVVSNASTFRMESNVPLLIPEVNPEHLKLINDQTTKGKIITNPNCVAVPLAMGLSPLMKLSEIESVDVVSLQAISGAGYPGVPSLDILGNTIPFINSEEEKIETETQKILGSKNSPANFSIFAHVNRVPVENGHSVIAHIRFKNDVKASKVSEIFANLAKEYPQTYAYYEDSFRPQPKRDITVDDLRVHIGRVKQGPNSKTVGALFMAHNLVRGAAGAAILNLELLVKHLGV